MPWVIGIVSAGMAVCGALCFAGAAFDRSERREYIIAAAKYVGAALFGLAAAAMW